MSDQDVAEFLSDRISCLEARFEARFDRFETRLHGWMENNGKQNVSIEKNTERINGLHEIIDRRSRRLLTISVAIASCTATLIGAVLQILIKCVF